MIQPFEQKKPTVGNDVYLAPSADIIGDVRLSNDSSVFFGSVLRGDIHYISIGKGTNIQDLSCLHVTDDDACIIGDECVIGHQVVLHGCTIGNRVLVGMHATIINRAVIGDYCIIGAGSLVTEGTIIPPHSLVLGSPAKVVRPLKKEEEEMIVHIAHKYISIKNSYLNEA